MLSPRRIATDKLRTVTAVVQLQLGKTAPVGVLAGHLAPVLHSIMSVPKDTAVYGLHALIRQALDLHAAVDALQTARWDDGTAHVAVFECDLLDVLVGRMAYARRPL